jgi:hypothetical protein
MINELEAEIEAGNEEEDDQIDSRANKRMGVPAHMSMFGAENMQKMMGLNMQ